MARKLLKALFWIFIIALLVLPLGLIYQISLSEMEEYTPSDSPVIRQVSIGTPVQATRMDIKLCETVSGSFTSTEVAFMELEYKKPYEIRWIVSYGDEIEVGQVLGYYYGEEVISTVEGIISNINTSAAEPYLMVDCYTPLVLECAVGDEVISPLKQFADRLTLTDGTKVEISHIARTKNPDGTTTVQFALDREGDTCGDRAENLTVFLGTGYPNVLVLPLDCVYQKVAGEDEPWYIRQVTEDGFLIAEMEVKIGYSDDDIAVVNGIEEGQYFDSGYKDVVSGDEG